MSNLSEKFYRFKGPNDFKWRLVLHYKLFSTLQFHTIQLLHLAALMLISL